MEPLGTAAYLQEVAAVYVRRERGLSLKSEALVINTETGAHPAAGAPPGWGGTIPIAFRRLSSERDRGGQRRRRVSRLKDGVSE